MTCPTCSDDALRLIGGECRTCYQYRYRHHEARPESLIVAHGRLLLERELTRRFRRIA